MEPALAFVATFATAFAGGAVGSLAARAGLGRRQRNPDAAAWRQLHQRRAQTYADFAESADQIQHIVGMWAALPPAVRQDQRKAAYAHLRILEHRQDLVDLDSGPDVQAAAQQLVDECTRLVRALDLYAPPSRVDAPPQRLTKPFLTASREYLDAEADRHFGLHRTTGRSLFTRLSTR
ncbi:hypothetical protein [Streptomyces sp. CL12-4]|uniref:hypothetical protein n=1 Tax=Streptomyces sp. CL12-4 TaxID=2810306 RepID=UPI001EFC23A4|nr:hypothetical protein [Streptomyces sp. CL12-4]MCG8971812.1 hypothetical protein [Streptomyces sp. CL12-4]